MIRQIAREELRSPVTVPSCLAQDTESYGFPSFERALNASDVGDRVDGLTIDLDQNVALLHADVFGERRRLDSADQNATVLLHSHLVAARIAEILDGDAEASLGSLRRTDLALALPKRSGNT